MPAEPGRVLGQPQRRPDGAAPLVPVLLPGPSPGPAIAAFSISRHITGPAAWTAALVVMALAGVLTRLAVVWIRGRRLTAAAAPAVATTVRAAASA